MYFGQSVQFVLDLPYTGLPGRLTELNLPYTDRLTLAVHCLVPPTARHFRTVLIILASLGLWGPWYNPWYTVTDRYTIVNPCYTVVYPRSLQA